MFIQFGRTKVLRTAGFISGLSIVQPIVTASYGTAYLYARFKKRK